jgi:hypothetical protein
MVVGGQRHTPAALPPGKTLYHCTGGWVGPTGGLEGAGSLAFAVQALASRYTD